MIDAIVTGGDGFIGRKLVARLLQDGKSVLSVKKSEKGVEDAEFWKELPQASTLFHLAGKTFVPDSWVDPSEFMKVNVVGTQNALTWCKQHGAHLILASAYVYGLPEKLPISEDDATRPNNPYALSKYLAEQLGEFFASYENLDVSVLRLFNVYGPGQRSSFLIPTLLSQVITGSEVKVLDLKPRRDYVYIDDVIDAFVLAAKAPAGFQRFNIGSGRSLSVEDVIRVMQTACGSSLPVISACLTRRNEISDVQADISRAAAIIGWYPKVDFSTGIQSILKEYSRDGSQRPDQ